jgi:hypothetical protein
MFDQHSYAFDVPAEPLREGDLFYKHEVGRWTFDNRLYTIIAGAAVFIFAFFGIVAQTPFLTARGCDSPFVGRVCQVLDMAYVSSVLLGTEREMADAEYERTELGEADVVWIDQTGVPAQLEYPEGYFQIANPEQFAQQQAMLNSTASPYDFNTSGFPPVTPPVQSGSSLIDTPAIAPKKNPKARPDKLPNSPFDLSDVNGEDKTDEKTANTNSNTTDPKVAQTKPSPSPSPTEDVAVEDKFGVFLNKRPMRVKAEETIADVNANKVKLDSSFKVTVVGTLGLAKDGKTIVLKNAKPVVDPKAPKTDPVMEKLVQDWILAVGDAGWFGYLDKLKSKQLTITIEQNDSELVASVKADQPSEDHAKTAASGLNTLLQIAATQVKDDEKLFLEKAKVVNERNTFILNFAIPKPVVQDMIQRKLAEQAADATKKPSGNAITSRNDNTAAR